MDVRALVREALLEMLGCPTERVKEGEELDEVTPPGHERMVRALKKSKSVDNPWAVAWAHYDKARKERSR